MARLTFRQGIARHGKTPRQIFFLQQNGNYVDLVVSPELTTVAFADGTKDYLFTESVTTSQAWGPFTIAQDYWLYWDINKITGVRTFGSTTLAPVYSATAPSSPAVGQMWFDISTGNSTSSKMHEYTGSTWVHVLRVFASKYANGTQFLSPVDGVSVETNFTGTQIGGTGTVVTNVGSLAYDSTGAPIINQDGKFFTTEDIFTTGVPTGASLKVNDILLRAKAKEPIGAYHVVVFSDYDEILLASPFDSVDKIYGVVEDSISTNDTANIIIDGVIFNEAWDFTDAINNPTMNGNINDSVYVTTTGALTTDIALTTPTAQPVGAIIGSQTILFRPGVYDPVQSTDHGGLIGLSDDDHLQYYNQLRGDAQYYPRTTADIVFAPTTHTHAKADITDFSHTHLEAEVTDLDKYTQSQIDSMLTTKVSVDGSIAMTGALTLPADPTAALQAATKQYVDTLAFGIDPKNSVEVTTDSDIGGTYGPTGGTGGTGEFIGVDETGFDGVEGVDYTLAVNTRVLVKNQTDAKENGIYIVTAMAGSPTVLYTLERSDDMDGTPSSEINPGDYTFVVSGLNNIGTGWIILSGTATGAGDTILLNTDDMNWGQISASVSFTAGNNINIDGSNVISVIDAGSGGTVDALTWNGEVINVTGSPSPADNQVLLFNSAVPEWAHGYLSFIRNASNLSNVTIDLGTGDVDILSSNDVDVNSGNNITIASGAALATTSVGNTNITATLALNLNSTGNTTLQAGTSSILLNNATDITLTSDNVVITPNSGNATMLFESGVYSTTFAAGTLSASTQFILPTSNGSAGYVLSTDGTGNTSWITNITATTLESLTDVVYIGSPAPVTNEVLVFNGSNWENQIVDHANLANIGTNTHVQIDQHMAGTNFKHTAADIINVAAGTIVATDVQAAIDELSTDITNISISTDRHAIADITDAVADDAIYVTGDPITLPGQEIDHPNPSPGNNDDRFGWMVSLSDDGTRCVVTAPRDDQGSGSPTITSRGSARIYLKTGGVWAFESFLVDPEPGPSPYDNFGISAMMSGDGTRVVVGAFGNDQGSPFINNSGTVYVYNRSGTTWTLDTGGTINNPVPLSSAQFGASVAINDVGDKIVIGADQADGGSPTGPNDAGAAYVYARSGENWTLEQTLDNPNPEASDFFGAHVEMSMNGLRIEVSAPQDNLAETSSGTIYIYRRDTGGTVWSLEATIANPDVGVDVSGRFGWSARFDSAGEKLVVSNPLGNDEPQSNSGVVYVYKRIGTEWIQEQKIVNPEPTGPAAYGAEFGNRVVMSGDGKRILIGVWLDDPSAPINTGSAYLYGIKDGVWEVEQKLLNPGKQGSPVAAYDYFGSAVALDDDGTTIGIGMYGADPYQAGAVFFYEAPILDIAIPSGSPTPTAFDEINIYNTRTAPIQISDASNLLNGSLGTYTVSRKTNIKLKYINGTVGWLVIES